MRRDDGNAMVEFSFLGVLLLIPLIYVVLAALAVQRAAFAVTAASRDAGRAFVTAPAGSDSEARAEQAARLVLRDHGLSLLPNALRITCSADPCLTPGAVVHVEITYVVALPGVAAIAGSAASIPVSAHHDEHVDRFRVSAQ